MKDKYEFQNLLTKSGDGKISGAMSPVAFIEEMAEKLDFKVHGLVRVHFNDDRIHNWYEDSRRKKTGLTGCDTLLVIHKYANNNMIMMFVDEGGDGVPVGMMFTDENEVTVTPIYTKRNKYAEKLEAGMIKEIMLKAFNEKVFEIPTEKQEVKI